MPILLLLFALVACTTSEPVAHSVVSAGPNPSFTYAESCAGGLPFRPTSAPRGLRARIDPGEIYGANQADPMGGPGQAYHFGGSIEAHSLNLYRGVTAWWPPPESARRIEVLGTSGWILAVGATEVVEFLLGSRPCDLYVMAGEGVTGAETEGTARELHRVP
jgi:hypothetical protein